MSALALNYVHQPFARTINTGASPESKNLENKLCEIVFHFRQRAERDRAFSELARAMSAGFDEARDQYSSIKVDARVSQLACRFLNTLPSTIPAPEVGLDPDGEISFTWIVTRDRQFSVSLSPEGITSYAGVFGGGSTIHGTEIFDDTVPMPIIDAIRRLKLSA